MMLLRQPDAETGKPWHMYVPPWFNASLDTLQTPRVKDGRTGVVWTQGSSFSFQKGDVLYDKASGYEQWSPGAFSLCVQIRDARPVSIMNGRRDPGVVIADFLRPLGGCAQLEKFATRTFTQDSFVRFLIAGEEKQTKRDYHLRLPTDAHGQPIRMFKAILENNVSKSIDQLWGICTGILADGTVTGEEARFFAEWVRTHAKYEPVWPFTDILSRVNKVMADGRIDDEEQAELKHIMETICGRSTQPSPAETFSTALPLNQPQPTPVVIASKEFCITGRFAFGTRAKVFEAISVRGGKACDGRPTHTTDYLVVGHFASRDWLHTNYGLKIERAVELREETGRIAIISEEHWRTAINTLPISSMRPISGNELRLEV